MKWLVFILILSSCSPAAKLRGAEKLIEKAEGLGAKWHVDSVEKEIFVPVPEIQVREVRHAPIHDTVRVEKERLKIKIVRLPGDSVYVEGKCETDTVRVKVTTTVTKTIKAEGWLKWWMLVIAFCVGVVIMLFRK